MAEHEDAHDGEAETIYHIPAEDSSPNGVSEGKLLASKAGRERQIVRNYPLAGRDVAAE